MNLIQTIATTAIAVGLTGCTTVHITGEPPSITQGVGFVIIKLEQRNKSPQIVATEGIGITATNHSASLGYINEVSVWLPDTTACRLLIFTQKNADIRNLREAISANEKTITNICIVSKEGESWLP